MTPTKDELAGLAGKLTDAQRKLLLHDTFDDGDGGRIVAFDANKSSAYALNRRGIVDDFFHLTPAGLTLRAHIQNESTNHG